MPVDAAGAPTEARPLVDALNALFRRVAASVENERRFTADAAHELRTPLAAIQTHAEVALASHDDAERKQALTHVTEGTARASRLVAQLLMLARLDARATLAASSAVNLSELAARHVADAAPFATEKDVNLGLAEDSQPAVMVRGDAELLGVLIRNLVDNAVRYTPNGGRVDVSVRSEADRALLTVTDTGRGIPREERARVLERFYRGRGPSEDGSGLGLSIVARIAELHGAELTLEDGPENSGLSVRIALSRAALSGR